MILVDSNVIIDVLTRDATWSAWSEAALLDAANRDEIAINPIIYAEIASGFATMAELDHHLGEFRRLTLPYGAGFVAGRAFVELTRLITPLSHTTFLHALRSTSSFALPQDSPAPIARAGAIGDSRG